MARRRVFKIRVQCPGIDTNLAPTANQRAMVGRVVALQRSSTSEVKLLLDGTVVGYLDTKVGNEVASAIDRGVVFTAVIEKALPSYVDTGWALGNGKFKQTGARLDIKVEYFLEKGQPAIETESCWRFDTGVKPPAGVAIGLWYGEWYGDHQDHYYLAGPSA